MRVLSLWLITLLLPVEVAVALPEVGHTKPEEEAAPVVF